jgi:hypothetical protein
MISPRRPQTASPGLSATWGGSSGRGSLAPQISPGRQRPGTARPDLTGHRRHRYYHRLLIEEARRTQTALEVSLATSVGYEAAWNLAEAAIEDLRRESLHDTYADARSVCEQHSRLTATVGALLQREPGSPAPGDRGGNPLSRPGSARAAPGTPREIAVQNPAVWAMPRPPTRAESHGEKVAVLRRRILDLEAELQDAWQAAAAANGGGSGGGGAAGPGRSGSGRGASRVASRSGSVGGGGSAAARKAAMAASGAGGSKLSSSSSSGGKDNGSDADDLAGDDVADEGPVGKALCACGEHLRILDLTRHLRTACPSTETARNAGRDCTISLKLHFSRDPTAGMMVTPVSSAAENELLGGDSGSGGGGGDGVGGAVGTPRDRSALTLPFGPGIKSPSSAHPPPPGPTDVYISYSAANASKGGASDAGPGKALAGCTDVHVLATSLREASLSPWITSHPPTLEQAVSAMQRCRALMVCVSDAFAADPRCVRECKFACNNLNLPVFAAAVSTPGAWTRGPLGTVLRDPMDLSEFSDAVRASFTARVVGLVKGGSGGGGSRLGRLAPPRPATASALTVFAGGDPVLCAGGRAFTERVRCVLGEIVERFSGGGTTLGFVEFRSLLAATDSSADEPAITQAEFETMCKSYGSSQAAELDLEAVLALVFYSGETNTRSVLNMLGYGVGLDEREALPDRGDSGPHDAAVLRARRLAGADAADLCASGDDDGYYGGPADPTLAPASLAELRAADDSRAKSVDFFVSYAWSDSREAVGARAYSDVDPRALCDRLRSDYGLDMWVDVRRRGEFGTPEDRRCAMARSRVYLAFVSEQFASDPICVAEFKYALNVLRLPVLSIVVGELSPVSDWRWMSLDVGAIMGGSEFFNFQDAARLSVNTERFAESAKAHLADAERGAAVAGPDRSPVVRLHTGSNIVDASSVFTPARDGFSMPVLAAVRAAVCAFAGAPAPRTLDAPLPRLRFSQARHMMITKGSQPETKLTAVQYRMLAGQYEQDGERLEDGEDDPMDPSVAGEAFIRAYLDLATDESVVKDLEMLGYVVRV